MSAGPNPQRPMLGGKRLGELRLLAQIYIAAHGPCSFDELFEGLCTGPASGDSRDHLSYTLRNMCLASDLACNGFRGLRQWWPNDGRPAPEPVTPATRKPRARPAKPKFLGPTTPPRDFDVMHAPPYVPPSDQAARAGSMDFKRCASHGYQC